jgi:hypothetical protein
MAPFRSPAVAVWLRPGREAGHQHAPLRPGDSLGSPTTVTVRPEDGGRTVDLEAGDRLVVELQGLRAHTVINP